MLVLAIGAGLAVWGSSAPALAAFTIQRQTGTLTFPATPLNGADQVVTASAAPTWKITVSQTTGWNVTLQVSSFTSGPNSIPASDLSYTASNGTITAVKGQSVDPTYGPLETGASGSLSAALKCVDTQPNYGSGQYTWTSDPAKFTLVVPATTLVGTYQATLTATLVSGP